MGRCFTVACAVLLLVTPRGQGAALLEEGFNYPAGSLLATNPPWSGTAGPSVAVVSGSLTLGNLQGTTPAGNMLQVSGATSLNVYRNFSDTPVTNTPGAPVYLSFLINCTLPPAGSNSQFLACLMEAGATSPNQSQRPLDLHVMPDVAGYRLSVSRGDSDPGTIRTALGVNTTHLIVLKFTFGTNGVGNLYIDPTPGGAEPASPNARAGESDNPAGFDVANMQVLLLHSPGGTNAGSFLFDALRVGTNWADVTPINRGPIVTGPQDLLVCAGSPAVFGVTTLGTPPLTYQWLTNGMPVNGATNDSYALSNSTAAEAANGYSVVVVNAFGSITSRVARLSLSHLAPTITQSPASQPVMPGDSNATFSVTVTGDPPLSYQWRTNGVAIAGATNSSYTVTNPGPKDGSNTFDVVVANVCGVATSAPALLLFPHAFLACAALPGFFSGVNLIMTNSSGQSLFAWSSSDPNQPITNWMLEGPLQEQPLNDGSGNSRYSINVNPVTSPVYYLLGQTTSGPYLQPVPVQWITTDIYGNNYFNSALLAVNTAGVLVLSAPPAITQQPLAQTVLAGKTVGLSVTAAGAGPPAYQWYFNATSALTDGTNATLTLPSVAAVNAGSYTVVVTNTYGSITSTPALLTVLPAPRLGVVPTAGSVQLNAAGVAGDTYWLQAATNLNPPAAWVTVATNLADSAGAVRFSDTNISATAGRFYRLVAP